MEDTAGEESILIDGRRALVLQMLAVPALVQGSWRIAMLKPLAAVIMLYGAGILPARAQVDLSTIAEANGFLNVQKLTCAQLAGTW